MITWADFMTEQPETPKRRGRQDQPAPQSLFEWALEQEQGAGLAAAVSASQWSSSM